MKREKKCPFWWALWMSCPFGKWVPNLQLCTWCFSLFARSDAALKRSHIQTDTPALAALFASSHRAPGTSISLDLPEEKSWDKAAGDAQLDPETKLSQSLPLSSWWQLLQHDRFMTNAVAIAGRIMCCKVLASASIQGGLHYISFAPCVVQDGLQAKGRLLIV